MKTYPFIGGDYDGHYLPITNPEVITSVAIAEGHTYERINSRNLPKQIPDSAKYRRGRFATRAGGMWIFFFFFFYILDGMTDDEAVGKLMANYCPT